MCQIKITTIISLSQQLRNAQILIYM